GPDAQVARRPSRHIGEAQRGAIGYADTMSRGEGHVVVPASVDIAGGLVVIASAVAVGIAGATTFTRAVAALGALFGFGMLALGVWQLQHENRVAANRQRRSEQMKAS